MCSATNCWLSLKWAPSDRRTLYNTVHFGSRCDSDSTMIRFVSFALLVLTGYACGYVHPTSTTTPFPRGNLKGRMDQFNVRMEEIMAQIMMQQLYVEERIRSDGQSGIKQIRQYHDGSRPYYSETHTYSGASAVHDHSNYDRTVGMGEVNMVMNGVDFKTRHNDYKLRMPSTKSSAYQATEDIPFPGVPPEVTSKKTLPQQVAEMKEWFRAWKDQNHNTRDYRKYFKPVLCYMEGAWTMDTTFSEPFSSDRHAIDATSWKDLQDKVIFTSYTGSKSVKENFAFLPSTMIEVEHGTPKFAQWNYRILCHPLKRDIPLKYLHLQDDLSARFAHGLTMDAYFRNGSARFSLYDENGGKNYSLMDELMSQIPGKNNYHANLKEDVFGELLYDASKTDNTPLNTAYYHRWYKVGKSGSKQQVLHRGFSDRNIWVAQTNQPRVAPMGVEHCTVDHVTKNKTCKSWSRRYTYAVPLEVIYMNPVLSWNPLNLEFWPKGSQAPDKRRVGGHTPQTAYNGTRYSAFYHTPPAMFTTKSTVGVLDKHSKVQQVVASGTRVVLPDIPGVGKLRMRYPIVPVHGEGSGVWKELDALKDMVMDMEKYKGLFENPLTLSGSNKASHPVKMTLHLRTGVATKDPPGPHVHDIFLSHDVQDTLKSGRHVTMFTGEALGHTHQVLLDYNATYSIVQCDGRPHCWDGHPASLHQV
ncbi:uncharacterized protein LOC124152237 [Haliotis rufescens]|uniref:uncharacterized protein LOC124152237 n=1 Tax=Haliotis rufescens TaxID=6454 RepID=UPI00201F321A|nr:uncharacterized protein LOC124152237 [Haliotis rufescens]